MRLSFTLGDALRSAARHAPGDAALVGDDGTLTWAALAENVDRVAATLRALVAAPPEALAKARSRDAARAAPRRAHTPSPCARTATT